MANLGTIREGNQGEYIVLFAQERIKQEQQQLTLF